QASEVFAAGYSGVTQKFIEPVSVGDIAIEGIRGLGAIDPDLTVTRADGKVVLSASGSEVAFFPAPEENDIAGWAKLTVDISAAARKASAEMKAADMETLYEAVFDGVLSNLDIFSRYAGAQEARKNRAKRDGFGGIGIRYRIRDGTPVIIEVIPKSPAAKAGLLKGDRITHVDGTGRLQSIERDQNPRYYDLIEAFAERSGVRAVLNTSFNENEPIVDTPEQAVDCFTRTDLDALCLGNYVVCKPQHAERLTAETQKTQRD
ncbi:MAG: PDZ domain-containing protein, partial [Planctomycetes bacterium]|nr:PDZ domain-containing protein [Planctomycetota bacterium]